MPTIIDGYIHNMTTLPLVLVLWKVLPRIKPLKLHIKSARILPVHETLIRVYRLNRYREKKPRTGC
jgi:hypothetical protein